MFLQNMLLIAADIGAETVVVLTAVDLATFCLLLGELRMVQSDRETEKSWGRWIDR